MKYLRAILAIAVVAIMITAPITAACSDAEKVPIADGEKGYNIENAKEITDKTKFLQVVGEEDMDGCISDLMIYLNMGLLIFSDAITLSEVKISTYKENVYSSIEGLTKEDISSTVIEGSMTLVIEKKTAKFFIEPDEGYTDDLMYKANEYFGNDTTGSVTAKVDFKVENVEKTTSEYAEANNKYVLVSTDSDESERIDSHTEFTYNGKVVTVDNEYKMRNQTETVYTFDSEISTGADAPTKAYQTVAPSMDISGCSTEGYVGGVQYDGDSVEMYLKSLLLISMMFGSKTSEATSSELTDSVTVSDVSIQKVVGEPTEDAAKTKLTSCGFTGDNDASKAKSEAEDAYDSVNGSSGSSGLPIWAIILIIVGVIILIAVIVVIYLKKTGRIW